MYSSGSSFLNAANLIQPFRFCETAFQSNWGGCILVALFIYFLVFSVRVTEMALWKMTGSLFMYINSVIPYWTYFTVWFKRKWNVSHILLIHKPKWASRYPAGFFVWLTVTVKILQGIPTTRAGSREESVPHGQQERCMFIRTKRADGCAGNSSAGRVGHLESQHWKQF